MGACMVTEEVKRMLWRRWAERGGPLPAECVGMTCGATTRAGTPCKRRDIYRSGRCKLHGGLSTGPRTTAGKAISAANGRKTGPHENGKIAARPNPMGG